MSNKQKSFQDFKAKLQGKIVNEHDLIIRAKLSKNNASIVLPVESDTQYNYVSDGGRQYTKRLLKNDLFACHSIILGIQKVETATGRKLSDILTFPSQTVFDGKVGNVDEYTSIMQVYDAIFSVETSRLGRVSDFHTRNFQRVPRAIVGGFASFEECNEAYELPYSILFDGSSKNEIKIQLPNDLRDAIEGSESGEHNELVLILKGFLGVDCSNMASAFK